MKRLAVALVVLLTVLAVYASSTVVIMRGTGGGGGGGTAVTDNFDRTNADSLGSNWSLASGSTADIVSNRANCQDGVGYQYWSANTFADNQYAEAKVYDYTNDFIGVSVRQQTAAATAYVGFAVSYDDGYGDVRCSISLRECTAGTCVTLGTEYTSTGATCAGTTIRLEVSGSNLTMKLGGVTRITATDSSITSGYAGAICRSNVSGELDDWSGGDL